MEKTLFTIITGAGEYPPFSLPATEELAGRTASLPEGAEISFGGGTAVKCDDDLFLAEQGGRLLLVKELEGERLEARDCARAALGTSALPEALEGWETDLSLASGNVLTALFRDGSLRLSPSPEPDLSFRYEPGEAAPKTQEAPLATLALKAVEIDEKRFILHFPETGETVVLNGRRFLLYAILDGRIVAGFVEIPPKEQQ